MLPEFDASVNQMLFDIADHQLHFKIVGMRFRQLFKPVEYRFESGQVDDLFDLRVQALEFVNRIHVI